MMQYLSCLRALLRLLLPVLLVFLPCACADDDSGDDVTVEEFGEPQYNWNKSGGSILTLWGNKNDLDRPFMKRAFERYSRITGNRLRIVEFTHRELEKKLLDGFAGKGPLPDVFLFPGGSALLAMNPDKNFHDFTKAPWVDDLTDTALSQTISNGRVVGLPHWEASIAGIIYNKKLFEKYRIRPPRNLVEFYAVCDELLAHGIIPLYLPFTEPTMLLYQFPLSSMLQDSSLLDNLNNGDITYSDIPAMKNVVRWYRQMAEKGYLGPDYQKQGWDGMDEAMKSGKYAMMLCWDTWLYSDFSGHAEDFAIMPAFVGTPMEGAYEGPNLMLLIVNENSPQKNEAINFITFLADPWNYNAAFAGFHTAPVFKKQIGSLTTPQYDASARNIDRLLNESLARPLIHGFGQGDAVYIERHMLDPSYTVEDCLRDMDAARIERSKSQSVSRRH